VVLKTQEESNVLIKNLTRALVVGALALMPGVAHAELLEVHQKIFGMD
jgi:hypothetical protein